MKLTTLLLQTLSCALLLSSAPLMAQVVVPASAAFSLNGGALDLGGTNLQIGGSVDVGSGAITNTANLSIAAGATLDGGSGTITLSGDFSNLGTFNAGTGQVDFVDAALTHASISGNSTFANLSLVSLTGKTYAFAAGSTQTIQQQLQILGTASLGIQLTSTTPGQVANINLLAGGTQDIAFVGVSNVHATGQHLAPSLTNDGGSGDALGWFANGSGTLATAAPVPALSFALLLLLGLGFIGVALRSTRLSGK